MQERNHIRLAERHDLGRVAEILVFTKRYAYRDIFNDYNVSFNEMQVVPTARALRHRPDYLENLLVFDDGIVKGMMKLGHPGGPGSGSLNVVGGLVTDILEIQELYVDPFFWHQGVGSELIDVGLDVAREMNCKKVFLWCLENNTRAVDFYKHWGFNPTGEKQLEEGTDQYSIKMERYL